MSEIPENFFIGAPNASAHRNQFRSAQELIDRALFSFDLRGWPENSIQQFRNGLEYFARSIISEMANAFRHGAQRGIDQM